MIRRDPEDRDTLWVSWFGKRYIFRRTKWFWRYDGFYSPNLDTVLEP